MQTWSWQPADPPPRRLYRFEIMSLKKQWEAGCGLEWLGLARDAGWWGFKPSTM